MDVFFLILLALMLLVFGYAQLQKGVFKTPGQTHINEEDEVETSLINTTPLDPPAKR